MKALVLAAGLGTRLREVAPNTPKPLMKVSGVPLLQIIIEKLLKLDIETIIINTHYLHEQIEDFIYKQDYRDKIEIVFEPELLGTAGTLKKNLLKLTEDDFFVLHGDNYFEDTLQGLLNAHRTSIDGVLVSMGTFIVENPESFGTVGVNSNLVVTEYLEKDPLSPYKLANSAIYIMKPAILEYIRELSSTENDLSKDLIPKLINRIQAIPLEGYFLDIGTPETYKEANSQQVRRF